VQLLPRVTVGVAIAFPATAFPVCAEKMFAVLTKSRTLYSIMTQHVVLPRQAPPILSLDKVPVSFVNRRSEPERTRIF
jgi:hypothetical protein